MASVIVTNATPGGPVRPNIYTPPAVVFAAGASLRLPGTSTDDSTELTFSGWFKVDELASGKWVVLNYFNRVGDFEGPNPCGIALSYLGTLEVTLQGHTIPSINDKAPFVVFGHDDMDELFQFGAWNHIYLTIDLDANQNDKIVHLHLNGSSGNVLENAATSTDSYPEGNPHVVWDANLTTSEDGASLVGMLPGDGTYFNNGASFVSVPIEVCNVMIWHGDYINPATSSAAGRYSAKNSASYIIRSCVEYMNSRGVNPLHALTAMHIESTYGTHNGYTPNLFQFLFEESFVSILGPSNPTGYNENVATNQHIAFANAWTDTRVNGSRVPVPNNYDALVRLLTVAEPLPYQKFIIHNLGGSAKAIGAQGSINGYMLLSAFAANPSMTLNELGPQTSNPNSIGNMLGQSKIYGATSVNQTPITRDTTVGEAVQKMIDRWNASEATSLTHLDAGGSVSNLSAFIDSDGFPKPSAIAAEKFGNPTFRFEGGATEFVTNYGTGGAVTVSGSISDAPFGPGPDAGP